MAASALQPSRVVESFLCQVLVPFARQGASNAYFLHYYELYLVHHRLEAKKRHHFVAEANHLTYPLTPTSSPTIVRPPSAAIFWYLRPPFQPHHCSHYYSDAKSDADLQLHLSGL